MPDFKCYSTIKGWLSIKLLNHPYNYFCNYHRKLIYRKNFTLSKEGVKFSETSCAGQQDLNLLSGADKFNNLPFSKIYHDSFFYADEKDEIIKHRQAEVVCLNGLPIKDAIKGIVCRSVAEKQTLLYLLKTQYPKVYQKYQPIIRYSPELNLFFNNGIFIKAVKYNEGKIIIEFNDPSKRYGKSKSIGNDVNFKATVYYINEYGNIINNVYFYVSLDYADIRLVNLNVENPDSKIAIVEVKFDDNLMYKNILNMNTEDLL